KTLVSRSSPSRTLYTVQAIPREISGHRISVLERAQGRVPSVVFSQNYVQKNRDDPTSFTTAPSVSRKVLLTTERDQLLSILDGVGTPFFCSSTFPLEVRAGPGSSKIIEQGKVLPIKLHRDEDGKILNLVLAWAEDGTELIVQVPIVYKGEDSCPGLEKGGVLRRIRSSLKFMSPAEHIPAKIEIDVSKLDIGEGIWMNQVSVHPSLKLLSKNDMLPVCKIMLSKQPENHP
ncbi:hypothetical protein M569_15000, partial [Genlisea aurea]